MHICFTGKLAKYYDVSPDKSSLAQGAAKFVILFSMFAIT